MTRRNRLARAVTGLTSWIKTIVGQLPSSDRKSQATAKEFRDRSSTVSKAADKSGYPSLTARRMLDMTSDPKI